MLFRAARVPDDHATASPPMILIYARLFSESRMAAPFLPMMPAARFAQHASERYFLRRFFRRSGALFSFSSSAP